MKPGEQVSGMPEHLGFHTVDITLEKEGETPFYLKGKGSNQVFPYVISGVGTTPKVNEG